MANETQLIVEGRKTFFFAADTSLMPEAYLEDYMAQGYETYIIGDDRYCPLTKKVEIIVNTFKDSILFFNIDAQIPGIDWEQYIKRLQVLYGEHFVIGVLYTRRQNELDQQRLEKYYLFDVGITGGCIALEYQKTKNFSRIFKVMYANQACGRRKNVRAICDDSSKVSFESGGKIYRGKLSDISISHFSCIFDTHFPVQMYEKISNIIIEVNGSHFRADAIYSMSRELSDGRLLFVFVFTKHDGNPGLDPELAQRLLNKIYLMVTDKVKGLMRELFDQAGKELRAR